MPRALSSTALPPDQVATCLNFNDQANFRRSFRRWTGCSPAEFKQLLT
ncbi:helix-turn-helix domain-containing protein [Halopseudomonas sp.]